MTIHDSFIPGDTLGGRIETYMWFGLASEQEKCIQMLPIEEAMIQSMLSNKELPTVIEHTSGNEFQCRAHLFSAVIDLGHDITGLADVYVKVELIYDPSGTMRWSSELEFVGRRLDSTDNGQICK